jgi:hypothetical protein
MVGRGGEVKELRLGGKFRTSQVPEAYHVYEPSYIISQDRRSDYILKNASLVKRVFPSTYPDDRVNSMKLLRMFNDMMNGAATNISGGGLQAQQVEGDNAVDVLSFSDKLQIAMEVTTYSLSTSTSIPALLTLTRPYFILLSYACMSLGNFIGA